VLWARHLRWVSGIGSDVADWQAGSSNNRSGQASERFATVDGKQAV
jgi:hypothetical protein